MSAGGDQAPEPDKFVSNAARWILAVAATWMIILTFQGIAAGQGMGLRWPRFDYELAGQFGDSFAPLNTIMAAIAAIAAIAAYRSQSTELRETRLREAANQQSADRRDFEETYFRLLNLLRETVSETRAKVPGSSKDHEGQDAFRMILRLVPSTANPQDDKAAWKKVYIQYQAQLGHYFRLVYHLLKFIDESKVDQKKFYARLLRATLSNPEIVLLGLNGWHGAYPKAAQLYVKYSMLHNIRASDALNRLLISGYPQEAFGDRDLPTEAKYGSESLD